MENLLRTYTDQELNYLFELSGLPEMAKQYCMEKYKEVFADCKKYDLREEEMNKGIESLLEYLKEECCWGKNTLREHAWDATLEDLKIETYLRQRKLGYGHEWSKLFCDAIDNHKTTEKDVKIYSITYQNLKELRKKEENINEKNIDVVKREEETPSDKEILLAVKKLAQGEGEIVERFIRNKIDSFYEETIEDLFKEAIKFKQLYQEIISEGHTPEDTWEYTLDLWDNPDSVFYSVYREVMKLHQPAAKARSLARFCAENQLNGWYFVEKKEYMRFPEKWQREIIADLLIKDAGKGWKNFENEIRENLGLETK